VRVGEKQEINEKVTPKKRKLGGRSGRTKHDLITEDAKKLTFE